MRPERLGTFAFDPPPPSAYPPTLPVPLFFFPQPLVPALSWFEQKAVAVLLTMLSLGMKNIKIGPQLPAFLTPNVLGVLVDKFGVKQVNLADHDADLKEMVARVPR